MFIPRTFRKKNRNHRKLQPKRHLEITRPAQLAKLSRSEFEPELFAHSAFVKFFVTFATNFLILSPFPLHFLILSPLSRSQAARLPQFVQPCSMIKMIVRPGANRSSKLLKSIGNFYWDTLCCFCSETNSSPYS